MRREWPRTQLGIIFRQDYVKKHIGFLKQAMLSTAFDRSRAAVPRASELAADVMLSSGERGR